MRRFLNAVKESTLCISTIGLGLMPNEDENFVLNLAKHLGLSCSTFRPDSQNHTKVDEGTLREQRLNSFLDLCKTSDTGLIVQGHNQDDAAETIIWRLSRGSSPQGLWRFLDPFTNMAKFISFGHSLPSAVRKSAPGLPTPR